MKIDNKKFLMYMKEANAHGNFHNFIKSIRVNKKSITVKVHDKQFLFNGFFTEKSLYNKIIFYLSKFTSTSEDLLKYRYPYKNFKVN